MCPTLPLKWSTAIPLYPDHSAKVAEDVIIFSPEIWQMKFAVCFVLWNYKLLCYHCSNNSTTVVNWQTSWQLNIGKVAWVSSGQFNITAWTREIGQQIDEILKYSQLCLIFDDFHLSSSRYFGVLFAPWSSGRSCRGLSVGEGHSLLNSLTKPPGVKFTAVIVIFEWDGNIAIYTRMTQFK